MTNKNLLIFGIICFAVVIGFLIIKGVSERGTRLDKQETHDVLNKIFLKAQSYEPGVQPFPKFIFFGPQEEELSISNYRGSYVLLNLWATWCPPCIEELPSLERLTNNQSLSSRLIIIALSVDQNKSREDIIAFLSSKNIGHFAHYHDRNQKMIRLYPVEAMPTTLLINPKGEIIYEMIGPTDWDDPEIVAFLQNQIL